MTKLNYWIIAILSFNLFFTACTKEVLPEDKSLDEEITIIGNVDVANAQNASEEYTLTLTEMNANFLIDGAHKRLGNMPEAVGSLSFQTDTKPQTAFLKTGFDIELESNSDISGAYIQLKDVEGNLVECYYEVSASAFSNGREVQLLANQNELFFIKGQSIERKTDQDGEYKINVDFAEDMPVGKFCYAISVFDQNGNVSPSFDVCVEIEAWAGNAELVGEWIFKRFNPELDKGILNERICSNGVTLNNIPSFTKHDQYETITLNEDGTYVRYIDLKTNLINIQDYFNCAVKYDDVFYHYQDTGYWAYNEDKNIFYLVSFHREYLTSGNVYTHEFGRLLGFPELLLKVTNNTMTWTYDGSYNQVVTKIFERI